MSAQQLYEHWAQLHEHWASKLGGPSNGINKPKGKKEKIKWWKKKKRIKKEQKTNIDGLKWKWAKELEKERKENFFSSLLIVTLRIFEKSFYKFSVFFYTQVLLALHFPLQSEKKKSWWKFDLQFAYFVSKNVSPASKP